MEDIKHWGQTEETPATEVGAAPSSDSMERESKFTGRVRALYDFNAENPTELTFKKGDELYVHYRQTEGWLVGFYKDEKLGLIPENYVEFLDE
ncbi:hypothetical protein K502DRAFT_322972 [Neoconidiobolus thromboides FSU 785]|nr:hypothetical protein K502DRAFT_322972 [Neoconidiobolus thromboides FSU 785]